ncbi:hypothetical protein KI387_000276 [Taxus chinensis]|uniref:HhH-GPD domain-containing protein n=1 Tax=Taxus chinensis TaxID=29808 RepID=A0AA38GTU7_TAXCH|nr:hypothetical protein KI387_000276 [Taxus chinensis]
MLMENNQRERSMTDILNGRGFSSPVTENNHRERSMADIMKRMDFSSPGMAPHEAQISPATPLRPIARKRKLVFDDEPLLAPRQTPAAERQWLGSATGIGPSSDNNYWFGPSLNPPPAEEPTAGLNVNSPPRIPPHQQPHYRCTNEKSSDPHGILGLTTAKNADAFKNAQRLFNALNRSVCVIPNENVSKHNANLGHANYHHQINPGSNICLNGWSRPFYPYFSPFNGYPNGILSSQYLHSAPCQPHQQTFTSLLNNGCSLAPETPEKDNQTGFVGLSSDERVADQENQIDTPEKRVVGQENQIDTPEKRAVVQENQLDTPKKIIQHENLSKTQSSQFVSLASAERALVQEKQQEIISLRACADVEGTAVCGDESILPSLIDPLSFTLQTPTKNDQQLAAEGEKDIGGIDLNKTPPPQKPRRKKHRPRVMREGPSARKSKAKNYEQSSTNTNFPDYERNPPGKKPANHDNSTPQKSQTDASVDELANAMVAGYQETQVFMDEFARRHPAVVHQSEIHISTLSTQEVAENFGQSSSIISSPIKRAFRENFKTLARKKEQFFDAAQPQQFTKQKGNKRLSRRYIAGDETDTAPKGHKFLRNSDWSTHIHSIHGSQNSISHRANSLDPMDMIIARLRQLQLNETAVGNSELVPYLGNGDLVPFEGPFDPLKKRKHRPKVDLDAETNRVWRLLMGKASEGDKQAADNEKGKKLEEEREIFRGRVDSFIARMRLVQGDRRFSQWKGSVVDSIVGAFLTQNVSDHLSSSAFIAMASRFPPVQKNEGTKSDSNDLGESEPEKEKAIEDVSYMVQFPNQALTEQNPGHSSVSNEVDELQEENLKEIANCGESFASNPLGDKGSSSQVMNSTNGSESNSDFGEQTNQSNWINTFNDKHSFTELLREVENRTLWGLTTFEKHHDLVAMTTGSSLDAASSHDNYNNKPLQTSIPSSEILDHLETGSEAAQDHMIDFLGSNTKEKDHQYNFSNTQGSSLTEDSMNAAATLWSLAQKVNSTLHSECLPPSEIHVVQASELIQSSSPPDSHLLPRVGSELAQSSTPPEEIEAIEDFGLDIPRSHLKDAKPVVKKVSYTRISGLARANIEFNQVSKNQTFDWESARKKAPEFCNGCSGVKKERDPNTMDAMNWEAVRRAKVGEIADTIKERGMNNILAGRIKAFLERLHKELGCIDLEWLRDIPPDDAKDFLLSIRGLGLKSVECIRLLSLQHLAFPVDTNVGRICVRLGWVPIMPLPESLQLHLLELYPVQANIQKYIWPRLCMLDQRTLYELHYQMITFGKVFCTKSKPNCNACPMRAECKHFASAFASARLSLQGPPEKSCSVENPPCSPPVLPLPHQELTMEIPSTVIPLQLAESSHQENCEPIIEEPATPEPECIESSDVIDEWAYADSDEIPVIKLNLEELSYNIQQICKSNMQDVDVSKALIMLSPQDASIPAPKLKYVHRLRTEHRVYEIPDNHPLLRGYEDRQPDDPSPYLLAIWTPGETPVSIGEDKQCCSPKTLDNHPCNQESWSTCVSNTEINEHTVKGTLLIPCRTAMRGSFPLNGTYFQHNEVFADHETSLNPVEVPRSWIWNLERRTVLIGTSIPTIFKGLTTREIQCCFWQGFVCVRAFDRNVRAPRPLMPRLHSPASKLIKTPTRQPRKKL